MSRDGPRRPVGAIKHPITADGYHAIFLRFLDEDDGANWVILDTADCLMYSGNKSELKLPWRLNHNEIGDYLHLGRVFNASSLGIGSDDGLIITVGSYNSVTCDNIRELFMDVRFKLNSCTVESIFDASVAVVKEAVQREVAMPDSDAGFAVKWLALDDPHRFAYRTQQGQWDEFTDLLQAVGILFPHPQKKVFGFFCLSELGVRKLNGDIPSAVTRRRYLWNLELIRYFQPFVAPELLQYTCVRDWLSGVGQMCYIPRPDISAHDQLEAVHLLFNWAQDKMSPKKLKLMLPY